MSTFNEDSLRSLLLKGMGLTRVEAHIYSALPDGHGANAYDTRFGNIYDRIACNPVYNRLIWGYSINKFASFTLKALASSKTGHILDLGCGSLAFTAKTYAQYSDRPVVLADQSLKMLRIAKSRLIKLKGIVPDNYVFLHADARRLPFRPNSFNTIISLNLLHCLDDPKKLLIGLKSVLSKDGEMYFTTLVKNDRVADRYLDALGNAGKLVPRSKDHLRAFFDQVGMPIEFDINGSMAFIYGRNKLAPKAIPQSEKANHILLCEPGEDKSKTDGSERQPNTEKRINIPINKNRSWIAHLHKGIDRMDEHTKAAIMRPAGEACASDLLRLCEERLQKKIDSIEDLVTGWNIIREERRLKGKWQIEGYTIRGVFGECGCPLVRSRLMELHPVQCYCSQGLMETIFSKVAKKTVKVEIKRTIGRGDDACEFLITV